MGGGDQTCGDVEEARHSACINQDLFQEAMK